jgi:hypothetical protein
VNAGISALRGNWGDASLSLFSAIPGIGDVAGASKIGAKVVGAGAAAYSALKASKIYKVLKPEAKYLKNGKHGIGWKEGKSLANKTGIPQGQWGSKADLDFAGQKAVTLDPGKGDYFELPAGHSSVVHMPDGSVQSATHFWVRNNGSGTFHGYPTIR